MTDQRERERYLIGAVCCDSGLLYELGLVESDWQTPQHALVWGAATALVQRGACCDPLSLTDELHARGVRVAGLDAYLVEAMNVASGWPREALLADAAAVRAAGRVRRAKAVLSAALTDVEETDLATLAVELGRELAEIASGAEGGPEKLGDLLPAVMTSLEQRARGEAGHSVTSGLLEVDQKLGELRPGRLYIVAARPGAGKTSLARTMVLAAAESGVPALMFSLEMTAEELTESFLAGRSSVTGSSISKAQLTYDDFAKLKGAPIGGLPIWLDDRVLTASQISAASRVWRARQKEPLALVVVDYLGLIRAEDKSESRCLEVGRMAWAMKVLAKEIGCPVVLLSQLNRASEKEKRPPLLSDLRDSGEIEQHAHAVLFPWREKEAIHRSGEAEIIVAKNRTGPVGNVTVRWNAEKMLFENADGPAWDE